MDRYYLNACLDKYKSKILDQHHIELMCKALDESLLDSSDIHSNEFMSHAANVLVKFICIPGIRQATVTTIAHCFSKIVYYDFFTGLDSLSRCFDGLVVFAKSFVQILDAFRSTGSFDQSTLLVEFLSENGSLVAEHASIVSIGHCTAVMHFVVTVLQQLALNDTNPSGSFKAIKERVKSSRISTPVAASQSVTTSVTTPTQVNTISLYFLEVLASYFCHTGVSTAVVHATLDLAQHRLLGIGMADPVSMPSVYNLVSGCLRWWKLALGHLANSVSAGVTGNGGSGSGISSAAKSELLCCHRLLLAVTGRLATHCAHNAAAAGEVLPDMFADVLSTAAGIVQWYAHAELSGRTGHVGGVEDTWQLIYTLGGGEIDMLCQLIATAEHDATGRYAGVLLVTEPEGGGGGGGGCDEMGVENISSLDACASLAILVQGRLVSLGATPDTSIATATHTEQGMKWHGQLVSALKTLLRAGLCDVAAAVRANAEYNRASQSAGGEYEDGSLSTAGNDNLMSAAPTGARKRGLHELDSTDRTPTRSTPTPAHKMLLRWLDALKSGLVSSKPTVAAMGILRSECALSLALSALITDQQPVTHDRGKQSVSSTGESLCKLDGVVGGRIMSRFATAVGVGMNVSWGQAFLPLCVSSWRRCCREIYSAVLLSPPQCDGCASASDPQPQDVTAAVDLQWLRAVSAHLQRGFEAIGSASMATSVTVAWDESVALVYSITTVLQSHFMEDGSARQAPLALFAPAMCSAEQQIEQLWYCALALEEYGSSYRRSGVENLDTCVRLADWITASMQAALSISSVSSFAQTVSALSLKRLCAAVEVLLSQLGHLATACFRSTSTCTSIVNNKLHASLVSPTAFMSFLQMKVGASSNPCDDVPRRGGNDRGSVFQPLMMLVVCYFADVFSQFHGANADVMEPDRQVATPHPGSSADYSLPAGASQVYLDKVIQLCASLKQCSMQSLKLSPMLQQFNGSTDGAAGADNTLDDATTVNITRLGALFLPAVLGTPTLLATCHQLQQSGVGDSGGSTSGHSGAALRMHIHETLHARSVAAAASKQLSQWAQSLFIPIPTARDSGGDNTGGGVDIPTSKFAVLTAAEDGAFDSGGSRDDSSGIRAHLMSLISVLLVGVATGEGCVDPSACASTEPFQRSLVLWAPTGMAGGNATTAAAVGSKRSGYGSSSGSTSAAGYGHTSLEPCTKLDYASAARGMFTYPLLSHTVEQLILLLKAKRNINKATSALGTAGDKVRQQSLLCEWERVETMQRRMTVQLSFLVDVYTAVITFSAAACPSFAIHCTSILFEVLLLMEVPHTGDALNSAGYNILIKAVTSLLSEESYATVATGTTVFPCVLRYLFQQASAEFCLGVIKPLLRATHRRLPVGSGGSRVQKHGSVQSQVVLEATEHYRLFYDILIPCLFGSVDESVPLIGYVLYTDLVLSQDATGLIALQQYKYHIQNSALRDKFYINCLMEDTPLVLYHILVSQHVQHSMYSEMELLQGEFYNILCTLQVSLNAELAQCSGTNSHYVFALCNAGGQYTGSQGGLTQPHSSGSRSRSLPSGSQCVGSDFPINDATLQKCVVLLLWDLGSEHVASTKYESAFKGLKLLCSFMLNKSWRIDFSTAGGSGSGGVSGSGGAAGAVATRDLHRNVCRYVADNTLYIINKIIQTDWKLLSLGVAAIFTRCDAGAMRYPSSHVSNTRSAYAYAYERHVMWDSEHISLSALQQEQSVRVLTSITKLLLLPNASAMGGLGGTGAVGVGLADPFGYIKYLPKIVSVVDSSLASPHCRVRYATMVLITELTQRLPTPTLKEYLTGLVVIMQNAIHPADGFCNTHPASEIRYMNVNTSTVKQGSPRVNLAVMLENRGVQYYPSVPSQFAPQTCSIMDTSEEESDWLRRSSSAGISGRNSSGSSSGGCASTKASVFRHTMVVGSLRHHNLSSTLSGPAPGAGGSGKRPRSSAIATVASQCTIPSGLLNYLHEVVFGPAVNRSYVTATKTLALQLLSVLFIQRLSELKPVLKFLPHVSLPRVASIDSKTWGNSSVRDVTSGGSQYMGDSQQSTLGSGSLASNTNTNSQLSLFSPITAVRTGAAGVGSVSSGKASHAAVDRNQLTPTSVSMAVVESLLTSEDLATLDTIQRTHETAWSEIDTEEQLRCMLTLLSHEFVQVRVAAVQRITSIWQLHRVQLLRLLAHPGGASMTTGGQTEAPAAVSARTGKQSSISGYLTSSSGASNSTSTGSMVDVSNVPDSDAKTVISKVIEQLLLLTGRETEPVMREWLAICLGEVGAVDPARLSCIVLRGGNTVTTVIDAGSNGVKSTAAVASTATGSGSHSTRSNPPSFTAPPQIPRTFTHSVASQSNHLKFSLPSWALSAEQFGYNLLECYLVPAFKSIGTRNCPGVDTGVSAAQGGSSGSGSGFVHQDRISYAIQEVLSTIYGAESGGVGRPPQLPSAMRRELGSRRVLDITEPFWSTRYVRDTSTSAVGDADTASSAVGGAAPAVPSAWMLLYPHNSGTSTEQTSNTNTNGSNAAYEKWIGTWTRNLINCFIPKHAVGATPPAVGENTAEVAAMTVYAKYFISCKSTVKARSDICGFLLPYIVYFLLVRSSLAKIDTTAAVAAVMGRSGRRQQDGEEAEKEMGTHADRVILAIIREIYQVLGCRYTGGFGGATGTNTNANTNTNAIHRGSSSSSNSSYIPTSRPLNSRAVQLVFAMTGVLEYWYKQGTLRVGAGAVGQDPSFGTIRALKNFLGCISPSAQAAAAVGIKAYTRALMFTEQHERERLVNDRLRGLRREVAVGPSADADSLADTLNEEDSADRDYGIIAERSPFRRTLSTGGGTEADSAHAVSMSRFKVSRHDGANNELPRLSSTVLNSLMRIYSNIDVIETSSGGMHDYASSASVDGDTVQELSGSNSSSVDALEGCLALRHMQGYAITAYHRVLMAESVGDWSSCLLEYNTLALAQNKPAQFTDSSGSLYRHTRSDGARSVRGNLREVNAIAGGGSSGVEVVAQRLYARGAPRDGRDGSVAGTECDSDDNSAGSDGSDGESESIESSGPTRLRVSQGASWDYDELIALESGRLRCLLELNQLGAVVDEVRGFPERTALAGAGGAGAGAISPRAAESTQHDRIRESLMPFAVEACWKLQDWDELDSVLCCPSASGSASTIIGSSEGDWHKKLNGLSDITAKRARLFPSSAPTPVPASTRPYTEDDFPFLLGNIMSHLHSGTSKAFNGWMSTARQVVLSSLTAASMDSYSHMYPSLVKLHLLRDVEYGFAMVHQSPSGSSAPDSTFTNEHAHAHSHRGTDMVIEGDSCNPLFADWLYNNERQGSLLPSYKHQSIILAARRCIYQLLGHDDLVANSWFNISTSMRHTGHTDTSRGALQNAKEWGLSSNQVLLQSALLLKDKGEIQDALMLLEPTEVDWSSIRTELKQHQITVNSAKPISNTGTTATAEQGCGTLEPLPPGLDTATAREAYAVKLLLATQLIVQSQAKHGRAILDRFKLVTELKAANSEGFFEYGKYIEYLYHLAQKREDEQAQSRDKEASREARRASMEIAGGLSASGSTGSHRGGAGSRTHAHSAVGGHGESNSQQAPDYLAAQYANLTIDLYGKCLQYATNTVGHSGGLTADRAGGVAEAETPVSKTPLTSKSRGTGSGSGSGRKGPDRTPGMPTPGSGRRGGQSEPMPVRNNSIVTQALPRLLTLWLAFTATPEGLPAVQSTTKTSRSGGSNSNSNSNSTGASALQRYVDKANGRVGKMVGLVHPSTWYSGITQLVSRTGHVHPKVISLLSDILIKIVTAYPQMAIWHIAVLIHSQNPDRKAIGDNILTASKENLVQIAQYQGHGDRNSSSSGGRGAAVSNTMSARQSSKNPAAQMANMITHAPQLFESFVELAKSRPPVPAPTPGNPNPKGPSSIKWNLKETLANPLLLKLFLVPLQSYLTMSISSGAFTPTSQAVYTGHVGDYSLGANSGNEFIASFDERVDVASSKAKPKTVTVVTTKGNLIKFLCKQEKEGDLRKDSRMIEFNHVVNRILASDLQSRSRCLSLRTFSVICLSEECGLLEWVNNTNCLRHLISASHNYCCTWPSPRLRGEESPTAVSGTGRHPPNNTNANTNANTNVNTNVNTNTNARNTPSTYYAPVANNQKEYYKRFMSTQVKYEHDLDKLVEKYRELSLENYRPCFHRWFIEHFSDPNAWLTARTLFTRSCAVWSVIGYVIGLGDRHTENILLDVTTGECVHVDFDCLFDKGLGLARPEIVPFRLTPTLVDAMGPTGIEGTFRMTMVHCMNVLRSNKELLLSVLEPFIRDPTVAWSRSGKGAQQRDRAPAAAAKATLKPGKEYSDTENVEARELLTKINDRLSGIYNLSHPKQNAIIAAYRQRNQNTPLRGLGAIPEEALPLSTPGQIQRLIEEATCEYNLAQMYIGWQPWN